MFELFQCTGNYSSPAGTTREQAVGTGCIAATQDEASASLSFGQTGHRTTDEEQLYLQHTMRLFCGTFAEFFMTWYS
jgi:hypothetical protein